MSLPVICTWCDIRFYQASIILFTVDDPGAGASTFLSPSSMLTPSAASAAAAVSAPKPQPNYNVSTRILERMNVVKCNF